MFTGLSAFPMTPVTANGVDEKDSIIFWPALRRHGWIQWVFWGLPVATPI